MTNATSKPGNAAGSIESHAGKPSPWTQARGLLWALVSRDLKVRYKRTLLGVLWALAEPIFMMLLFTIVFSFVLRMQVENYSLFVLCGVVVWGYFKTGVMASLDSVKANAPLIKKVYFPRQVLPIAAVLGRTVHFMLSLLLLLPFFCYFEVAPSITWIAIPLLLLVQLLMVTGMALLFSALATLYEDVGFLVGFALTAIFYLSPVIYPLALVPQHLQQFYLLNPFAAVLHSYHQILLQQSWPPWGALGIAALVGAFALALGHVVFQRLQWTFAEVL